ncbi:aldose epimerase family protein [Yoonia sp. SS1-5]|uniref:Aldose epimerase family protein n=1 Tax=Yoonia rhodophyticola TaxID=3137370 RepID=A0AAN0MM39_9RHOB
MKPFGASAKGEDVHQISLSGGDLSLNLLTWGAVVQGLHLKGVDHPLTLGSSHLSDYEGTLRYHGSLIGPIANRISNARVRLDGIMYELERNEHGQIHLHSGAQATQLQVWDLIDRADDAVTLGLHLPDGMCGLPGNRDIRVTFKITARATLQMTVTGTTDAKTCMNFANHSYWNLDGSDTWAGHHLRVAADHVLPGTTHDYPTGEIADVTDTPMDFRTGQVVNPETHVFNQNFCVSDKRGPLQDVLWLTGKSGLQMILSTTEPGVQIYDGRVPNRPGRGTYEGLAIEAQCWPDAPNNPNFPSIIVTPDAPYEQITTWRFRTT